MINRDRRFTLSFVAQLATCLFIFTNGYTDSVYQYTDKNGNLVIGNAEKNGAKKIELPELSVYALPMSIADINATGYTSPNLPAAKIRGIINNDSGIINDTLRQKILVEELTKEHSMLTDSEQLLAQGKSIKYTSEIKNKPAFQERIKALEDSVSEHKKNIEILNAELGN